MAAASSNAAPSTSCARSRWTRCSGRTPGTRARRWRSRRSRDVLFTRVMKYDATEPDWPDRDRFVLSAGHASMLIYSMLYLCGLGLELDDLRHFRQWGSKTPGHPEKGHTKSVEVTTGPLGQGIGNAVGIALAEKHLRDRFGAELCDHHVFAICSDGDLMEGISHEAASFAGHFRLGHLVVVYDDNHITIDGDTELTYTDDVPERVPRVRVARRRARRSRRRPRRARSAACATAMAERGPPDAPRAALAHRLPVAASSRTPPKAHGEPARRRRGRARQGDPRAAARRGLLRSRRRPRRSTAPPAGAAPTRDGVGRRGTTRSRRRLRSAPRSSISCIVRPRRRRMGTEAAVVVSRARRSRRASRRKRC